MKTLNEFIKEITASKELQDEMKNLKDKEAIEAFFKAHDCDATAEDFGALVKLVENKEGELPDDLAEAVAGGFPWGGYYDPWAGLNEVDLAKLGFEKR